MTFEQFLLQPLCISLAIIGIGLLIIELRSDFDKSFLLFGIFLILLSIFCAPDLWNQAQNTGKRWIEFQHIVVSFMCPVLLQYLYYLCKKKIPSQYPFYYFSATVLAMCFVSGLLLKEIDGITMPTVFYFIVFMPFFIFTIVKLFIFLISQMKTASPENTKVLRMHLIGLALLIISGFLDLIQLALSKKIFPGISSFTMFGTIGVGVLLTYLFSERLVILIRERLTYISRLQDAYKELEHAKDLSELGKSTAIINHEIGNYTMVIHGYAQLIKHEAGLSDKYQNMLTTISDTAEKLSQFSREILDFSKAKIISEKRQLAIYRLISNCVQTYFYARQSDFKFIDECEKLCIHGDWKKLEHVFVNLFKNSFEAGARNITVKFIPGEWVLLITIEDDGSGVSESDLHNLFKAFHTTKVRGTGLGLATSRSIIEGHGGYISVISKNIVTRGSAHGLVISISFPLYTEKTEAQHKDNIVLIEQDLKPLLQVVQTMRNVYANPHVIHYPEELKDIKHSAPVKVIGSPSAVAKIAGEGYQCYSLASADKNLMYVVGIAPDRREYVFNEEFVVSVLLKKEQSA